MRLFPLNRRQHHRLSVLLLAVLLFRAYVPAGFMPAGGTPFLLELCPAASPMSMAMSMAMSMPAHHHHESPVHGHFTDCPFGGVSTAGPVSHVVAFDLPAPIVLHDRQAFVVWRFSAKPDPAHPPRGPPSFV